MATFATFRERYEFLKNGPGMTAIKVFFGASSPDLLSNDDYETLLDLVSEAVLAEDDIALFVLQNALKQNLIVFQVSHSDALKEAQQLREKRCKLLIEAISKELQRLVPTQLLAKLEQDEQLRACLWNISRYPGATSNQLCHTVQLSAQSWQRVGYSLWDLGLADCDKNSWRLTAFGQRVLEEFQTKRLLADQGSDDFFLK